MYEQLQNSIAKEVLRLAIQIAPSLSSPGWPIPAGLPRSKAEALQYYRHRLIVLDCGLTARELDVCVRSLLGMTAEGTALELDIKKSSVITYRKRAYGRLGISSQSELFRLLA
ncbi:MAG TPA: LuxR C-terminal-related transcriptional regulator [Aliidongia sp.]|uniref:helix-turn-helix transcriptional regulator n=1 Tax=Aliidongia sp. TaxID=1914230 RepID=UPI002DDCFE89|nr:LuxR C-terminal-related transcriptional regulator [Aliidongia sp.]HEV2678393.1 LuxR C-terminal-related transcriptional regulator [Aliidongia sp.]